MKGMKTFRKLNIKRLGQVFILLTALVGWNFAQQTTITTSTPKPLPKAKTAPKPKINTETSPITEAPETPVVSSPGRVRPGTLPPTWDKGKIVPNEDDTPFEKSIEVDEKVNINLCIFEGNVRINGWDRDEIRVFVRGGSKAGFRPRGKNEDGNPTGVTILGYDPLKDKGRGLSECLSGEEIELDVPKEANLTKLDGLNGEVIITVESVAKARISINQGNIQLRGIQEGIYAKTYEGDINVEDSYGPIELYSTNGNIFVYNVDPLEDSDILKAKTNNGILIFQSSTHLVVEGNTISGSIKYVGEIQMDGQYKFSNTSGEILLGIPRDSSCTLTVISQKDKFLPELPFKVTTEAVFPPSMKRIVGTMGTGEGEATIFLQTDNGKIRIKRQN